MDDLISRQQAIDTIMGQPPEPHYPSWYAAQIEKLPSAQPGRKKGKWIYHPDWEDDGECPYECSECGMGSDYTTKYCPRCGADMRGEQDGNQEEGS
jgi:hypothetical protein